MNDYIEVREPGSGKLLFLFNPQAMVIEIKRREVVTLIDLVKLSTAAQGQGPAAAVVVKRRPPLVREV